VAGVLDAASGSWQTSPSPNSMKAAFTVCVKRIASSFQVRASAKEKNFFDGLLMDRTVA
jgi:hypothetical protein